MHFLKRNLSETVFTDALPFFGSFFKGDYISIVRAVGPVGTAQPGNSEDQIGTLIRGQELHKGFH